MSAVYAAGKTVKSATTKQRINEIFLTFKRYKESRFQGYYRRVMPTNEYLQRKEDYRKNVLKPLEEIPTLAERLAEMNAPDPVLGAKVDIGFPSATKQKVSLKDRLSWHKNVADSKVRLLKEGEILKINISQVENDWKRKEGFSHLKSVANHYGIFHHLFDHGYFTPCVPLDVSFNFDEETISPVCMGNIMESFEAKDAPNVSFPSEPDSLWTLVLTNLDGHLLDTNAEYLHWFVGNIKGNDLQMGDTICDYLRPFPMRGTGYHRLVFVLYKQDKELDFTAIKKAAPCLSLKERTFKTFDFYKEHQDHITPAGLAFFQCTWDKSLTDFFHNVLNMREPVFEYIHPPKYVPKQVHYPHLQPFNKYLDQYRDPKEIEKEVLLKRLKTIEPFKEEPPMPKYPCLHKPDNYRFSWQADDILMERLRIGKYRGLRPHSVYHQEDNHYPDKIKPLSRAYKEKY
ncbi:39S ribosomal protein L38, mitochondrial-like [Uloborus diversus]|uniref:39S ribosomal protein L38, mitochondrial-like n=1 Tax=Uloborus diversus TaxID=327109 RepID=UPI00240A1B6B|nr:39S ribosomal protein L38, mitochondrial-like [Uloborus diversus]